MEPRRLLDDPAELSELENRVLTAAGAAPGAPLQQRIWSALSAKLPPGGGSPPGSEGGTGGAEAAGAAGTSGVLGGAATAGSAGSKGIALLSIAKAASVGVSLGLVATTAAFSLAPSASAPDRSEAAAAVQAAPKVGDVDLERTPRRQDPAQASPGAVVTRPEATGGAIEPLARPGALGIAESASAPAPRQDEPELAAPHVVSPGTASVARFPSAATPAVATGPAPAPIASQSAETPARGASTAIREESRLVATARDALRSGNAGRALALLERARREFPHGTLAQEREALSIEALAVSGQTSLAAERARRFLRAHPSSMHAARVRAFAGDP